MRLLVDTGSGDSPRLSLSLSGSPAWIIYT